MNLDATWNLGSALFASALVLIELVAPSKQERSSNFKKFNRLLIYGAVFINLFVLTFQNSIIHISSLWRLFEYVVLVQLIALCTDTIVSDISAQKEEHDSSAVHIVIASLTLMLAGFSITETFSVSTMLPQSERTNAVNIV